MESKKDIKLRPCPFCGSKDLEYLGNIFESAIHCESCEIRTPWFNSEEEAAQYWNGKYKQAR